MKLLYLAALLLLASCFIPGQTVSNIDYLGTSHAATDSVTVFVDAAAIEKPYTVIGKGYIRSGMRWSLPVRMLQAQAIDQGERHGADAVLITENINPASGLHAVAKTDSAGRETVTVQNAGAHRYDIQRFTIQFLKYKQ